MQTFEEWIPGEMDRGLSQLEVDQMHAAWNAAAAAANTQIENLQLRISALEADLKTAFEASWKAMAKLTTEREVSDKLEKALKLADIQYMGCGGNLLPEEIVSAMQSIIRAALAEVATLRNTPKTTGT